MFFIREWNLPLTNNMDKGTQSLSLKSTLVEGLNANSSAEADVCTNLTECDFF